MQLWVHLTDLIVQQHAAAICRELGGGAQEMIRQISPVERQLGGIIAGRRLDPVSHSNSFGNEICTI